MNLNTLWQHVLIFTTVVLIQKEVFCIDAYFAKKDTISNWLIYMLSTVIKKLEKYAKLKKYILAKIQKELSQFRNDTNSCKCLWIYLKKIQKVVKSYLKKIKKYENLNKFYDLNIKLM